MVSATTKITDTVPERIEQADIQYERKGGCFVTTRKAVAFVIIALLALIAVGALMYFLGPHTKVKIDDQPSDIEKLLDESLNSNIGHQPRLPSHIYPLYYRLRIHPYLNEPHDLNFTFYGQVAILIQCIHLTNKIIINSEDLNIFAEDTKVTASKELTLHSLSQTNENFTNSAPSFNNTSQEVNTTNDVEEISRPTVSTTSSTTETVETTSFKDLDIFENNTKASLPTETASIKNNNILKTVETTTTSQFPNVFHSTSSSFNAKKLNNLKIKNQVYYKNGSTYIINLESHLSPGINYTLHLKFTGKITNNLIGLYKTSYADTQGHRRWLLATDFEPVYARRVFPCFDEPSFKAPFEISVARRTNMTVLSNMPLRESENLESDRNEHKGWVWDHFKPSPPMPPHLVAFVVCDFKKLKPLIRDNKDLDSVFHIWAPENKLSNLKYAREISPRIFTHLEEYFGQNYPLSKIDFVSLPELSQTATDGWGLIFFRDSALLLEYNSDNWLTKSEIFTTIVRKLTTQWFGNLVTMNWWSGSWLVEGFSTFMGDNVKNNIEPSLGDPDGFSLRVMQTILDTDQLKSVRSLSDEVNDLSDIEQIFDDVALNKGSCLIRMLNYTVGESLFQESVRKYLQERKLKSSNEDNFWEAFTLVSKDKLNLNSNLTVGEFMNSWIRQEGYPVVTVIRNYVKGDVFINQTRFVHGQTNHNNSWYIPLTYRRKYDNQTSSIWLEKGKSLNIANFTTPGKDKWILFNIDQAGFYRVNYDEINWMSLQEQLNSDHLKISPANRGQMLNDAFELAYAGSLNYHIPFELTNYLKSKERNHIPWHSIFNSLRSIEHIVGTTHYNGIFQKYVINLVEPLYDELGTSEKPGETQNDKLLRTLMIQIACHFKYEPCLDWAKSNFHKWMVYHEPDKANPIPNDVRDIVQCSAIRSGGEKEWHFLWQRTLYPLISPIDLKIAYASLGCSQEPWIITNYLEKSLNGNISLQNVPDVWKSIGHPVGLHVGFLFIRTNWENIYSSYAHVNSILNTIFEDFLSNLSTEIDLQDLTIFYKNYKKNLKTVSPLMLNVVDRIKWRISWYKSHMATIATWLLKNHK